MMFEVCTFVLAILLAQNDTLNPASLPRAALSDRGETRVTFASTAEIVRDVRSRNLLIPRTDRTY